MQQLRGGCWCFWVDWHNSRFSAHLWHSLAFLAEDTCFELHESVNTHVNRVQHEQCNAFGILWYREIKDNSYHSNGSGFSITVKADKCMWGKPLCIELEEQHVPVVWTMRCRSPLHLTWIQKSCQTTQLLFNIFIAMFSYRSQEILGHHHCSWRDAFLNSLWWAQGQRTTSVFKGKRNSTLPSTVEVQSL